MKKHKDNLPIASFIKFVICEHKHLHIELADGDTGAALCEIVFDDIDDMCVFEKNVRAAINEICDGAK